MIKKPLVLLGLAAALVSSVASASSAQVSGPLGDSQLVRGKKIGLSYLHYGANGSAPNAVVTVRYGFHGGLEATTTMSPTGYGNQVAFLDAPSDASGFWYQLEVNDGIVQKDGANPFYLDIHDRAVAVSLIGNQIDVKYAGPVMTTYDSFLHLGWNNWGQVGDAFMTRSNYSYSKAGIYYDYDYVDITPPAGANYLDFVFKDQRNGGVWDDNGGAGWHQSLTPFVSIGVNQTGTDTVYVTVTYANGAFNPPGIHYGVDGWQFVANWNMWPTGSGSAATVQLGVSRQNQTFNCAFFGNGGQWENNYGMNWNVALH